MQSVAPLHRPWLLADIGGTNARFGWLADGAATPSQVQTLPTAGHESPAQAARHYLDDLAQRLGPAYRPPRAAAWAVATAVGGDEIGFTNSGWSFSRAQAAAELQLDTLLVLNDFEALALSLPQLQPQQLRAFGGPDRGMAGGALAVIGPGTGLGVAGLLPTPHGWAAIPGEGGHASLSASDEFEAALLALVRAEYGHASAERLLSGIGLPVLHAAVARVLGQPAPEPRLTAEQVVDGALRGGDPVCQRSVGSFCALLGSFAGNVALTLGARGGVYIGGGIVPRLGEAFFTSDFRQRFEAKGRFQEYLQAVPTLLITDTLAALTGAAQALEQHGR
jgi:glucokinase